VLIDRASLLSAFPAVDEADAHPIATKIAEMAVEPLTEPPTGPDSLAIDAIRWIMGRAPGNAISWEEAHSAFREMWKKDQLPMFGYAVLDDSKRGKFVEISPVNMMRPWRIYPGWAPGGLFADEPPQRNEEYLGRVLFDQREEDFTGVIVRSSDLLKRFPPLLDPNRRQPGERKNKFLLRRIVNLEENRSAAEFRDLARDWLDPGASDDEVEREGKLLANSWRKLRIK
jgi:hypothetical protein